VRHASRMCLALSVLLGMTAVGWKDTASAARPDRAYVEVDEINQLPELHNGCEVTALAIVLDHAGKSVGKMQLARDLQKDATPLRYDGRGGIAYWGNPSVGFVGDITGARRGYGVYHAPIAALMNRYLPGQALDLSGGSFDSVLDQVANGKPVIVWTTVHFTPVSNWVSWNSPSGKVSATFSEHAAVLIGYDAQTVTLADPLDGQVDRVNRARFLTSWEQMGRQAVTYR
jgi:uncharacterized protein YvpB